MQRAMRFDASALGFETDNYHAEVFDLARIESEKKALLSRSAEALTEVGLWFDDIIALHQREIPEDYYERIDHKFDIDMAECDYILWVNELTRCLNALIELGAKL